MRLSGAALLVCAALPVSVLAETPTLEQRVQALELRENEKGAEGAGKVGFWFEEGLRFRTANESLTGHIGGHVIAQYISHLRLNEADGKIDTFFIDSGAIDLQGRLWKSWELVTRAHINPDGANLYYGWVEFNRWEEFKVRAGLFKEPFSQEETEDEKWVDLPEHGLTTLVVPGLNLGAEIRGTLFSGILRYELGVFNGTTLVDAIGLNGDTNSDKDIAARVEIRPGATSSAEALRNLMIGGDFTRGHQGDNAFIDGLATAPVTETNFHQDPGTTNFTSNGVLTRACLNVQWIWGPLSVKSELIYYKSHMNISDEGRVLRGHAWSLSAGVWLLGSTRRTGFRPELKPKFLFEGGFGDVQVVGRWSGTRFGDTLEEHAGFTGSRSAQELAAGVNWYPNPHVRITLAYFFYSYDRSSGRAFFTNTGRRFHYEDALVIRAQIDF